MSKIEALKEMIRAWGMNPEQLLTREALSDGAATYKSAEDNENHQLAILGSQLRELVREATTVQKYVQSGGSAGI